MYWALCTKSWRIILSPVFVILNCGRPISRIVLPGHKPQIWSDIPALGKTSGIVNRQHISQRRKLSHPLACCNISVSGYACRHMRLTSTSYFLIWSVIVPICWNMGSSNVSQSFRNVLKAHVMKTICRAAGSRSPADFTSPEHHRLT